MRHALCALAGVLLIANGCGLFSAGQAATATAAAIEKIAQLVRERTGRDLDDLPMECEVEAHPESNEILMLCTVHTKPAP